LSPLSIDVSLQNGSVLSIIVLTGVCRRVFLGGNGHKTARSVSRRHLPRDEPGRPAGAHLQGR